MTIKIGINGMGRIGRAVARRARSFGMKIHYHNRSKLNQDLEAGATYHDNIKSLFSVSDILSINCPATKETKNIINKDTLLPLGLVIVICTGLLWISNELNAINYKLTNLTEKLEDQWTKRDMENWGLKLKLENPEITIPEIKNR